MHGVRRREQLSGNGENYVTCQDRQSSTATNTPATRRPTRGSRATLPGDVGDAADPESAVGTGGNEFAFSMAVSDAREFCGGSGGGVGRDKETFYPVIHDAAQYAFRLRSTRMTVSAMIRRSNQTDQFSM